MVCVWLSTDCLSLSHTHPHTLSLPAGNSGVGKTSLIVRVSQGQFAPVSSTLGLDFSTKTLTVGEERVVFQLWDTAGQERWVMGESCDLVVGSCESHLTLFVGHVRVM